MFLRAGMSFTKDSGFYMAGRLKTIPDGKTIGYCFNCMSLYQQ